MNPPEYYANLLDLLSSNIRDGVCRVESFDSDFEEDDPNNPEPDVDFIHIKLRFLN